MPRTIIDRNYFQRSLEVVQAELDESDEKWVELEDRLHEVQDQLRQVKAQNARLVKAERSLRQTIELLHLAATPVSELRGDEELL